MSIKKILFATMPTTGARYIGKLDIATQYDEGFAITSDTSGNTYLVGQANASTTTAAYAFLVKLNSSGVVTLKLNLEIASLADTAKTVAVDASGNIYVAGQAGGTNAASYAFLVKYTSAGIVSWQRSVNTSSTAGDVILSCKVDSSGNVYVLGNLFVAKYNSSGVQQWQSVCYHATLPSYFVDMTIDSSGNAYCILTYGSNPNGSSIVKYDTNGNVVSSIGISGDVPYSIDIDSTGNVYTLSDSYWVANGVSTHAVTVSKYNNSLAYQWCYYFGSIGAGKLVVSSTDLIYVVSTNPGVSNNSTIYCLNSAGLIQWTKQLSATLSGTTTPIIQNGISVDTTGNMYGIGLVGATTSAYVFFYKFALDGTIQTISGQTQGSYTLETGKVITYTTLTNPTTTSLASRVGVQGIPIFKSTQPSFRAATSMTALVPLAFDCGIVDSSGNIIVLNGYTAGESSFHSIDPITGVTTPTITVSAGVIPRDFVLDSSNNKFIIGNSTASIFTAKILANNSLSWAHGLDTAGNDNALAITIDNVGDVYVLGGANTRLADSFILIAKYTNAGSLSWQKYLSSTIKDTPLDIFCHPSQANICVLGTVGTATGAIIALYDSAGNKTWHKVISGTYNAGKCTVDSSGNIYVALFTTNVSGYLIKYNSTGTIQWQIKGNFSAVSLTCDSSGNIYLLSTDRLIKFNSSGVYQNGYELTFPNGGSAFRVRISGSNIIVRAVAGTNYINTIVTNIDGSFGTSFGQSPISNNNGITFAAVDQTNLALLTSTVSETTSIAITSTAGAMTVMADPTVTIGTATTTAYPSAVVSLGALSSASSLASSTSAITSVIQTLV